MKEKRRGLLFWTFSEYWIPERILLKTYLSWWDSFQKGDDWTNSVPSCWYNCVPYTSRMDCDVERLFSAGKSDMRERHQTAGWGVLTFCVRGIGDATFRRDSFTRPYVIWGSMTEPRLFWKVWLRWIFREGRLDFWQVYVFLIKLTTSLLGWCSRCWVENRNEDPSHNC